MKHSQERQPSAEFSRGLALYAIRSGSHPWQTACEYAMTGPVSVASSRRLRQAQRRLRRAQPNCARGGPMLWQAGKQDSGRVAVSLPIATDRNRSSPNDAAHANTTD